MLRVTVMPDTVPWAKRFRRRTTPCWSIPCPLANVAHTVRSARLGPVGLQKNSRLFGAPDVGAVTTTVPDRGLVYVYSAQSGVTRLMHVDGPDCAEAVSIRGAEEHPAKVRARVAAVADATLLRARRIVLVMAQMVPVPGMSGTDDGHGDVVTAPTHQPASAPRGIDRDDAGRQFANHQVRPRFRTPVDA